MKKYLLILIGLALQASALSLRAEVLVIAHPAVDLNRAVARIGRALVACQRDQDSARQTDFPQNRISQLRALPCQCIQ